VDAQDISRPATGGLKYSGLLEPLVDHGSAASTTEKLLYVASCVYASALKS
jgi:hypothetical protein